MSIKSKDEIEFTVTAKLEDNKGGLCGKCLHYIYPNNSICYLSYSREKHCDCEVIKYE